MIDFLTYHDIVPVFLRTEYAGQPNGVKLLARDASVSTRTAENWLHGLAAPRGESLLNLMAASPSLEASILRSVASRRAARRDHSRSVADVSAQRQARRYAETQKTGV